VNSEFGGSPHTRSRARAPEGRSVSRLPAPFGIRDIGNRNRVEEMNDSDLEGFSIASIAYNRSPAGARADSLMLIRVATAALFGGLPT